MSNISNFNKPIVPLSLPLKVELEPEQNADCEDFEKLIAAEIGPVPPMGMTTELFVERLNVTPVLRYYFQEPTLKELAGVGLVRQGYWLRVKPGSENFIVSVPRVAGMLRAARLRTMSNGIIGNT